MATTVTEHHIGAMLRRHREQIGLSVRTLANRSGFSPSFISQVEHGAASPSIGSLEKIAACLQVSLSELFRERDEATSAIVRAKDRPRIESGWSRAEIESLRSDRTSVLESLLITLQPRGASGKAAHRIRQEQFVFVVSGEAMLTLDGETHRMRSGDAVTLRPQSQALWVNPSKKAVRLLFVSPAVG